MPISTINQNGLNAPLTLTSPVLTTPNLGTPSAINLANATGLSRSALPAGSVLQVVQGISSTSTSISSTSYTDTSISASITPSSASSKILVLASISGRFYINANLNRQFFLSIVRASTTVFVKASNDLQAGTGTSGYAIWPIIDSLSYLDSPNTTSSTTYKIQGKVSDTNNATVIEINGAATSSSSIILMEIAG
jgi:hypothetical protein